ncbi:MAG: PQQ-dependent sugar dehydrogenase [Actinomycetales bacterium]|nr:PQQ-dependent sugar dehydrogenase [Actinomycetales bacterium]
MTSARLASAALAALLVGALAACTTGAEPPGPAPSASPSLAPPPDALAPLGDPIDVVTGLAAPWSMVRLNDGSTLVSERDSGRVLRVEGGATTLVGTVPGVVHEGEGGLLGLAVWNTPDGRWLYAYLTTSADNRVVRMPLESVDGALALGAPEVLLSGLAKARNHDGGRIAFGPDDMLYVTVGDAGVPERAQDPASLNGKILRMSPEGVVPADNPTRGSYVYSLGHRNPQGLAWNDDGQLYAAEFGQDTWDEFNSIEPGANYGWPIVEGRGGEEQGFVDPLVQWPTDEASPSGLARVGGTFFLAGLGGQRLWAIDVDPETGAAAASASFVGELGRLRDVVPGPDGTLWALTNNTDGRGSPRPGDDRIVEIRLAPAAGVGTADGSD